MSQNIQNEFDQIADLWDDRWTYNDHYHELLLKHIPKNAVRILDIGCGTGALTRKLARCWPEVIGIDFSQRMIDRAASCTKSFDNILYKQGDVHAVEFDRNSFDAIVSVATLHHLDIELFLRRTKLWLKPGGILLILDLRKKSGAYERALRLFAFPVSRLLCRIHNRGRPPNRQMQEAWQKHRSTHDEYLTINQLQQLASDILPGAKIRHLLLYRMLLLWQKPEHPAD